MSPTTSATHRSSHGEGSRSVTSGQAFHLFAAAVLLACVVIGFRHFWFGGRAYPGRELTPPIRGLVVAHGVAMALWMVLLVVQSLLVVRRRVKLHMTLGKAGGLLGLAIVALGWKVGIESARVAPPEFALHGLGARAFMAISVLGVTLFGIGVGVGIAARKRPHIHRAAMVLGTLAAVTAALDRIDWLTQPLIGTALHDVFGPFAAAVLVGALLFLVRCAFARRIDRVWCAGFALLCLGFFGIWKFAGTEAWDAAARSLLGA